jgi:hypothetical protein
MGRTLRDVPLASRVVTSTEMLCSTPDADHLELESRRYGKVDKCWSTGYW